jgi:hypothetical protein
MSSKIAVLNESKSPEGGGEEGRIAHVRDRWQRFVAPAPSGLPRARVLFAFPILLVFVLAFFVATGLTGSSTGYLHQFFSNKADPALIAGHPESIRSDEWAVQTAWTISQVEQGLPITNRTFPGGIDTTVQSDLPSTDWSVAFRPHLLGFLFLPLDNAMALKWWLPGMALMAACYMFIVSLIPRRPISAALLAAGFFFAPFFQWWYLPITFWPAVWCMLTMASAMWLLKSGSVVAKAGWMCAVAYVTVTMAVGVYVPFIVDAVYVVLFFVLGVVVGSPGIGPCKFWPRVRRVLPLLAAGAAAGAIVAVWAITRLSTIERFLGTIYPGQRLERTGQETLHGILTLLSAPFTRALGVNGGVPLAINASEASTFFLVGLFLVVPLIWLSVRDWRVSRKIDGLVVASLALAVIIGLFLLVPGWDTIAHLLFLDRTTDGRIRLALGLLAIVATAVYVRRVDRTEPEHLVAPWWCVASSALLCLLAIAGVATMLFLRSAPLATQSFSWLIIGALLVVSTASAARSWLFASAATFAALSLFGSATVNPIYRGVFDINDTAIGKQIDKLQRADPGAWVGVGSSYLPTAVLVQSGVPGYNGFQGAPSRKMWNQIDPTHSHERAWNRLANVSWVAGTGAPDPRNPAPDQIQLTFSSCDNFAQAHVKYVLTDEKLAQACLTKLDTTKQGPTTFTIYEVTER